MPIYEYRCGDCERRVSIFFPSFSAAESRIAAGEARCPKCNSANLSRLMSRVYTIRGGGDGDMDHFTDEPESMFEGLDEDDPRSVARWARRMKDTLGEEANLGPEFDQAIARIESGEDPDKVMDDIDMDALGGGMDDDALGEGGADDDFGPA